MDKNNIKKFAVWARRELIEKVSQKALQYGIEEGIDPNPVLDSVNGKLLSDVEKKQRKALVDKIKKEGYAQVIEEVAYTWFNRFIALRFMEVNGYLPSHIRVFSDDNNSFKPQIITEALHLEFANYDLEKVIELKQTHQDDELYKYLLIAQCNDLSSVLPKMFQKIEDYTELLLPDYLLREGSVLEQMIASIEEDDWHNQVQIIGWLYQFYNSEPKESVLAGLKKNIKITKDKIPAATQLFTPDWIVKYMVDNSLGKLWAENNGGVVDPDWEYFVTDEQNTILDKGLNPTTIKFIDPCCGSGHIISYAFDVFIKIYESYGMANRDAVKNIVENNIWAIDIDDRAAQLAYFSIMMKAVQYDRRFLRRTDDNGNLCIPQPNVFAIHESNEVNQFVLDYFVNGDDKLRENLHEIIEKFKDAKTYGSVIKIDNCDFSVLKNRIRAIKDDISMYREDVENSIIPLIQTAEALSQKYDVVVTNPPYMAMKGMDNKLADYLTNYYEEGKSDLFSAFILRGFSLAKNNGYIGMLTPFVWMSILSYEGLRNIVISDKQFVTLTQLEYNAFPEACVPVCTFVLKNTNANPQKGTFIKLSEFKGAAVQGEKTLEAIRNTTCEYRYEIETSQFAGVPGKRIAYWASEENIKAYGKYQPLSDYADVRKGMSTADDKRFLRMWHEIDATKFKEFSDQNPKWFRLNKGGSFRRWYGNNTYVVNWENNGQEMKAFKKAVIRNESYYNRTNALTWTYITNYKLNVRFYEDALISAAGPAIFTNDIKWQYVLGFLNSNVAQVFANNAGGETMTYEIGEVSTIPVAKVTKEIEDEIITLVNRCIDISKNDWDAYESSWNFKKNPLVSYGMLSVEEAYARYKEEKNQAFDELKENEEKINRIFIDVYDMGEELAPTVSNRDVTVHRVFDHADEVSEDYKGNIYIETAKDVIENLISYAVGCMFGRYSLDEDGLVFAGGEFEKDRYKSFIPDEDGIIPITDDEYFPDDIVERFLNFIKVAFGDSHYSENISYIAKILGGKGTPKEIIREYFVSSFYAKHCSDYSVVGSGQRPIYWLFTSGKKKGFTALMYIHRYKTDTIARLRTDYIHEQQARYRTAIDEIVNRIDSTSGSDKVKLNKKLNQLKAQDEEIHAYEEKIHHLADQMISINLDDGVKKNYEIFKDVLAKIK